MCAESYQMDTDSTQVSEEREREMNGERVSEWVCE